MILSTLPKKDKIMPQLTPEQRKVLRELSQKIASQLLRNVAEKDIINELTEKHNLDEAQAKELVQTISEKVEEYRQSPAGQLLMHRFTKFRMVYASIWFVIGLVFLIFAPNVGLSRLVSIGPFLFGCFYAGREIWSRYRNRKQELGNRNQESEKKEIH